MKRFFILSILAGFLFSEVASAYTLTEADYLQQGINYFGDEQAAAGCSSPSPTQTVGSTTDHTLPQVAIDMLDDQNIKDKVEQNKERYLYAEEKTGVAWQIMAALHYREASMDSSKSITNGETLRDGINADGVRLYEDPNLDAENAAKKFVQNANTVYEITLTENSTTEDIANSFLAYNRGFMYKNWSASFTQSPYVMNYYDDQYIAMKWIQADSYDKPGGTKLNDVMGKVDSRPGALTVLHYIGGVTIGGLNCIAGGAALGDIIAQAQTLAWNYAVDNGTNQESQARPEFVAAVKEHNASVLTQGHSHPYADCGIFVATVMRSSGADPNFPGIWTKAQKDYMMNSGKYQIETNPNSSNVQAGDILVFHENATGNGHIMFYSGEMEGEDGETYWGIDASLRERVPGYRAKENIDWMLGKADIAARLIKE